MDNIQNLLQQIDIIRKKHAEKLDATGGRFNIFDVLRVKGNENKNSLVIAAFLDPQGTHGLKHKFLECFIETLGEDFTVKNFNCKKAQVRTESWIDNGRLDILIEDNQNKAIIIENKIYAGDQWEQLQKYEEHALEAYREGNYQILYLTLYGNDAADYSGKDVDYSSISHEKTMINWLKKCVVVAEGHPMVRETINQYINHLKKLTNQDMDTKNKEEIVDMIVNNNQFLENAQCISNIWGKCEAKMRSNLIAAIKITAEELKLKFENYDLDEFKTDNFVKLFKEKWDFYITLYYDYPSLLFGLLPNDNNLPKETKYRLREILSDFNTLSSEKRFDNWIILNRYDEFQNLVELQKSGFKFVYDRTKALVDAIEERYLKKE